MSRTSNGVQEALTAQEEANQVTLLALTAVGDLVEKLRSLKEGRAEQPAA